MGWFGKLFGTDKAADNLLDKDKGLLVRAGGWIDGLGYTEQEKAEQKLLVREWGIRQLEALAPFKVVQRILAFCTMFMWIFVGINVMAMMWFDHSNLDKMMEFAFSDYVFWPTVAILALYTGGGTINSLRGGK